MSSKRGRKRNDNLPPNRARDVQRAFRARRAAHLQALEERVSELEAENDYLRQALSLPPSSRPPLGRGPTGKDKPRTFDTNSLQSLSPQSRESSVDLSPTSRPSSQSPTSITASMSSRPMAVMEPSAWNESMLLNDQSHQTQQSQHSGLAESSNSPYHLSPMPAPVPTKEYLSYVNPIASSSRQLVSDVYISSPNTYAQSPDRPVSGNYGGHNFSPRGEIREEIRQQYVYTHPYQHDPNMRSQSPSPITQSQSHPHIDNLQRDPTIPFPHRRSSLDPQGYSIGQGFPHLPNPFQLHHNPRPPDHPRQPDHPHIPTVPRPAHYGQDGRLNPVP